jgi:O-antigen/teichoic acid export membrane protein
MRRVEILQIIRNVSSSWVALGTSVLVGLLLWPFILHHLGDAAAGIWVLIFSITGYYGLFDLGIRSSVVRYVSKARAEHDFDYASRLISTSVFSYSCIGALALVITLIVTVYIDDIFRIDPSFRNTARWLLLMVGSAVSLGFPLGVAGGMLEGLQRFDVTNLADIASTLIRALLILIAIRHGGGLLVIAAITMALPLVFSFVRWIFALRLMPVRLSLTYVNKKTFREMAGYSGITFITIVSARLRFRSDEIIIGTLLSASAITYFNVGGRIVDYAEEVVEKFAQIFVPMSSHSDARGDIHRLQKIFILGNRFSSFITFPITIILVVLGRSVIEAWVGKKYVAASYPVLVLMAVPSALMMAQSASGRVLFGMSRHKTWAIVTLVEGIANVVLSILLVRPYGIVGDALGTAIPLTATMIFFLPRHVCGKLGIPVRVFLREAYSLPILASVPFFLTLLLLKQWFIPHKFLELVLQIAVASLVYGGLLAWFFASDRALRVGEL